MPFSTVKLISFGRIKLKNLENMPRGRGKMFALDSQQNESKLNHLETSLKRSFGENEMFETIITLGEENKSLWRISEENNY